MRTSIWASNKMALNRSKIAFVAFEATSDKYAPHSRTNPTAISTESSVGFSNKSVNNSKAKTSCATFWFTKWAKNLTDARHWVYMLKNKKTLSLRRNDRLNCRISLDKSNSPTIGIFELIIEISAEKTGVKGRDADCALRSDRTNKPRPRIRFSEKSSITIFFIFETLT